MKTNIMKNNFPSLIKKIKNVQKQKTVFVGFDGFIDKIIKVVDIRFNSDKKILIKSLNDFYNKISNFNGSKNIEIINKRNKPGGNGPNTSQGLIKLGTDINIVGSFGKTNIYNEFKTIKKHAKNFYSISNPGYTYAFEFNDGKIMFGNLKNINKINYKNIIEQIGRKKFYKMISESSLVCCLNWTMIINMTEIIENIFKNVRNIKKQFFIDISDPEKRSRNDLSEFMDIIKKYSPAYDIYISLNENEADQVLSILNLQASTKFDYKAEQIAHELGVISVVHSSKRVAVSNNANIYSIKTKYVKKPTILTGAGDNFNSGLIYGIINKFSLKESIILGTATAGFYISEGESPNINNLIQFIENWKRFL